MEHKMNDKAVQLRYKNRKRQIYEWMKRLDPRLTEHTDILRVMETMMFNSGMVYSDGESDYNKSIDSKK